MVEAKHEFIDDNPYLVYSPDAEATASGGGGLQSIPWEYSDSTWTLKVKASELAEILNQAPAVIAGFDDGNGIIENIILLGYRITKVDDNNEYQFFGVIIQYSEEFVVEPVTFRAATGDNYPVN